MDIIKQALSQYGVHEVAGSQANPIIVEYFKEVGHPDWYSDEIPWCAVFVNWCLLKLGLPMSQSELAASFLTYGTETTTPQTGDLVVFSHPESTMGLQHVTIFVNRIGNIVYCLGGNQDNEVNITAFNAAEVTSYRKLPSVQTPPPSVNPSSFIKYNTSADAIAAIKVFKSKHGLVADGLIGVKTISALQS